jgi:hypothetical protein
MGIIRIYFPEVQTSDRSENPPRKSWSVVPQFEIDKIAIESMGSSSPPKAAITISDW